MLSGSMTTVLMVQPPETCSRDDDECHGSRTTVMDPLEATTLRSYACSVSAKVKCTAHIVSRARHDEFFASDGVRCDITRRLIFSHWTFSSKKSLRSRQIFILRGAPKFPSTVKCPPASPLRSSFHFSCFHLFPRYP